MTSAAPSYTFSGYAPYQSQPGAGATSSSSNAIGAIGATGASGSGSMPMPTSNGTVSSPAAGPTVVPFTGAAANQEVDQKIMLCVAIALVSAILLI